MTMTKVLLLISLNMKGDTDIFSDPTELGAGAIVNRVLANRVYRLC